MTSGNCYYIVTNGKIILISTNVSTKIWNVIVINSKINTNFNLFFLLWGSLFIVTNSKINTNFNLFFLLWGSLFIVTNSKINTNFNMYFADYDIWTL